jgi:hypothetical protein
MTSRSMSVLFIGMVSLLGGCTPWRVVRQAMPNPLQGQRAFQLAPLDFRGLYVGEKPEPEWLGGKDAGQRASWQGDLQAMTQIFAERFVYGLPGCQITPPGGAAPFTVVPHIGFIEPGFYAGIVASSTHVRLMLRVMSGSTLLDEIDVEVSVPADITNPASGTRLRQAAAQLGEIAAHYLRERTGS